MNRASFEDDQLRHDVRPKYKSIHDATPNLDPPPPRLDASSSFFGTTSTSILKLYTMTDGVHQPYSIVLGAKDALADLLESCGDELPTGIINHVQDVYFAASSPEEAALHFPCPLKEQEATAAIKALEACAVAAIADLRNGWNTNPRAIHVDLDKIACFLMSAYVTTVDGLGKADALIKTKIPGRCCIHGLYNSAITLEAYSVLLSRHGP
jgi:hypothetical protein